MPKQRRSTRGQSGSARRVKRRAQARQRYQFHGQSQSLAKRKAAARRRLKKLVARLKGFAGQGVRIAAVVSAVVVFLFLVFIARLTHGLPDTEALFEFKSEPTITVVDVHGEKIGTRGLSQAGRVRLSEMPPHLPLAVLAVEDRRFYHHGGIDFFGLARAARTNFEEGHIVQGGSTISQQLAKILFLTPERTYKRKLQEALLAMWLEHKLTKEEILELYLNRVYLGAGAYGVEAAAQRYFGKSARDLNLVESAMIAGLLKAPSRYAPTASLERAEERTALVLDLMEGAGYITPAERAEASRSPARIVPASATPSADYVLDWIVQLIPDYIGKPASDIIVETSIDLGLQRAAESALSAALDKDGPDHNVGEGAVVAMTPDGSIVALVGGRSYVSSSFNRALYSRRPPGSAFKPFVYAAAIEAGYSPWDYMLDQPVSIGSWHPTNYDGQYLGAVTLQTALSKSLNTVAVELAEVVGRKRVIDVAERFGISSDLQDVPSLALGSEGVGLLELTSAYAVFANGGETVIPHVIEHVTTRAGEDLYDREGGGMGPAADIRTIGLMNRMMTNVVEAGTGRGARVPGQIVAGKTGTGNDHRDAWFMGFTSHYVAGVWIGNDDFSPMKGVTGGSLPAAIFAKFMTAANQGLPTSALPGSWVEPEPPPPAVPQAVAQGGGNDPVDDLEEGLEGFFRALVRTIAGN